MFRKSFRRRPTFRRSSMRRKTGELVSFRLCKNAVVVSGNSNIPDNLCSTPLIDMTEVISGNDNSIATAGFKGAMISGGKLWYGLAVNNNQNGSTFCSQDIDDLAVVTIALVKCAITPNTFAPAIPLHLPNLCQTQGLGATSIDKQTDGAEILWEAKHYLRLFCNATTTGFVGANPDPFSTAGTMALDGSRIGEPIRVKSRRFIDQNHAIYLTVQVVDGLSHAGITLGTLNYTIEVDFEWRFMMRTLLGGGRASPGI